jgi:hypothetical protein
MRQLPYGQLPIIIGKKLKLPSVKIAEEVPDRTRGAAHEPLHRTEKGGEER